MNIAHVTATFLPYHGGTGMVCYSNALGIARLGHQVAVYTAAHPPLSGDYSYPPEISVHRLPIAFRVGNAPLLPGLINLRGYDLVHLHFPFIFGQEMLWLLSYLRGVRYVITYHQDVILSGMIDKAVRIHEQILGRIILTRAERLFCTSLDYFHASRIKPYFSGLEHKVGAMPNGVDTNRFHPHVDPQGLRQQYGFSDQDRVIGFVGGLDTPHYFKGVEVLLKAFQQLNEENTKLLIVGDGDLRPRYVQQAHEMGIADRVVFAGRVSDELLPAHYAIMDMSVLPSVTMGEAFGIVLLEAMSTGKPVIGSNLPGVRTVIDNGRDGLWTEPGNADDLANKLRDLLASAERRAEMGRAGRAKTVAQYDWLQINKRLEMVYREVLAT